MEGFLAITGAVAVLAGFVALVQATRWRRGRPGWKLTLAQEVSNETVQTPINVYLR